MIEAEETGNTGKTPEERREILARLIESRQSRGRRLESVTDYQAMFSFGKPGNSFLRGILALGINLLWLPIGCTIFFLVLLLQCILFLPILLLEHLHEGDSPDFDSVYPYVKLKRQEIAKIDEYGNTSVVQTIREGGDGWFIHVAHSDSVGLHLKDLPDLASALAENEDARTYLEGSQISQLILRWVKSARNPQIRGERIVLTVELAAQNQLASHPAQLTAQRSKARALKFLKWGCITPIVVVVGLVVLIAIGAALME